MLNIFYFIDLGILTEVLSKCSPLPVHGFTLHPVLLVDLWRSYKPVMCKVYHGLVLPTYTFVQFHLYFRLLSFSNLGASSDVFLHLYQDCEPAVLSHREAHGPVFGVGSPCIIRGGFTMLIIHSHHLLLAYCYTSSVRGCHSLPAG